MVNTYKICYSAKWPDGKLLDDKQPFMNAFVQASDTREAVMSLLSELKGLKVKIMSEPQAVDVPYES